MISNLVVFINYYIFEFTTYFVYILEFIKIQYKEDDSELMESYFKND